MAVEELFQIFSGFSKLYTAAQKELEKIKQDEERARKREEAKAQQAKRRAAAKNKGPDDAPAEQKSKKIVDGTLKTLRTNDAFQIMKIIRQRRKKRGSISTSSEWFCRRRGLVECWG